MVITIFLCTPLRIRYLQPKILCSCKGEGFLEGRVFPITTPALMAGAMVTPIDGSLLVIGWDHENWRGVLTILGGNLEVQEVVLQDEFLLVSSIEALLVLGGHSGKAFC